MTRNAPLLLDGPWSFWTDPDGTLRPETLDPTSALTVSVPAPWQAHSAALRNYVGPAWYQREIEIPEPWLAQRLILHFGAVDYRAEVWLNEDYLGEHEGGYLPFEFDVTGAARSGTNRLTVRVSDPPALFAEIPHGKQSWYGALSGLWQSVWLQPRAALHITRLQLRPDLATGELHCDAWLSTPVGEDDLLHIVVTGPDGAIAADERFPLEAGSEHHVMRVRVDEPRPWSPDDPALYTVTVTVLHGGEAIDGVEERCGFRTIETRDGRLYLNGELLYLRGALDQDYYPDTICTPPSTAFLEDQLHKAKAMGLNCLRCHIKVPDPRYYEVADRLGMLIWSELPNWRTLTPEAAERAWATMEGIVERDGNHPSIIIWTLVNEDWGTDLLNDAAHRSWLKSLYHRMKALDPTRLVVDNSPCVGNFHIASDLEDYHFYRAIPDHADEWEQFVSRFAARLAPTYSPYGDAERSGDEPLILSEFGNWGLPDLNRLRDSSGGEPWWAESGLEWGDGVMYPHGVQERFLQWGLDRTFGSWEAFVAATQWQQFEALRFEIEAMRRYPAIVGYVITEFTDLHWEANGLLDLHRNPKAYHERLREINADTMLFPVQTRHALWSGERAEIEVAVAHGGTASLEGATATWSIGEGMSGESPLPPVDAGEVATVGPLPFRAPTVDEPSQTTLRLALRDAEAGTRHESERALAIYPRTLPGVEAGLRLWVAKPALATRLQRLGYDLVAEPTQADVVLTTQLAHAQVDFIREGGRLLLLANRPTALPYAFLGLRVQPRRGTVWEGDWASSFAWLRRDGPFAAFPGGPLLDASWGAIAPDHVISGLGPWDFHATVYAGLFVGWIHKVAALVTRQRYGAGQIVLSTLCIAPRLVGVDPVTTHLLDALLLLAAERRGGIGDV